MLPPKSPASVWRLLINNERKNSHHSVAATHTMTQYLPTVALLPGFGSRNVPCNPGSIPRYPHSATVLQSKATSMSSSSLKKPKRSRLRSRSLQMCNRGYFLHFIPEDIVARSPSGDAPGSFVEKLRKSPPIPACLGEYLTWGVSDTGTGRVAIKERISH